MRIFVILLGLLLACQVAMAGEDGFAGNEEEIFRGLTSGGMKTRGITRGLNLGSSQKRGVKVVVDGPVGQEYKTINLDEKEQLNHVNLKIEFDYDSSSIRPDSYRLLNELGSALKREGLSNKKVVINGHTDSDGSEAYNYELSLARAQSVKDYLTRNCSVVNSRLSIAGYGEVFPVKPNNNLINKQMNRRVEIQIGE